MDNDRLEEIRQLGLIDYPISGPTAPRLQAACRDAAAEIDRLRAIVAESVEIMEHPNSQFVSGDFRDTVCEFLAKANAVMAGKPPTGD